ncbi:MAG: 2-dehydropantoate 2-reductase N-terminal domain-containing protein [Myxococcota bacterium]|nr:2-dehydropantoate 2-reductase N-terminal domain-containing protein [Myxococcota bacterium]
MAPRLAIVGAGSVGLSLTARLAASGSDVWLLARRAESALAIAARGIDVYDPASGDRLNARPAAVSTLERCDALDGRLLIVCVRAPDSEALAPRLAGLAPEATVVCAQNDVDNEDRFSRHFRSVIGVVVRQTCARTAPNAVNALGAGRLIVGAHPSGETDAVGALADAFRLAGFDVGISPRIGEDKWLKLCINLMSVPNALIHPDEHTAPAFVEIKATIVEEARAALSAAGITARSCDGRDRSLDEEIAFQRASRSAGQSARRLPVYNAVWGSLRHGSPLEADLHHERILALSAAHGLEAPMNRRALELVLRARREARGPESARCSDFLSALPDR